MTERMEALRGIHSSIEPRVPFDDFVKTVDEQGWEVMPIHNDGIIGGFLVLGHEMHFGVTDEAKRTKTLSSARVVRAMANDLFLRLGWLETRLKKGDGFRKQFSEFWGFEEVGQDEHFVYMKCEAFNG